MIREVLTREERSKLLTDSDNLFYSQPRFCTHVDGNFLSQLTQLYREKIAEDCVILDLMSSWVSHLPPERRRKKVIGHGMNEQELKQNGALDEYFLRNLNEEPSAWPVESNSVDAVVCCVSVQYLQQPEAVFAEMHRVLKPGGVAIVSFSNRLFYEKAIAAWRQNTDFGRQQLVKSYFQAVVGFSDPDVVTGVERPKKEAHGLLEGLKMNVEEWLRAGVCDPFFAVIAYKESLPDPLSAP